MSKGFKVVSIVLSIAGVLVVVVIVAGIVLWNTKGAEWKAELREVGSNVKAEAAQAGASAAKEECVQLAIARLQQDSSFMGQVKAGLFTEHCLDVAKGELPHCAGAPPQDEILKTVAWRLKVSEALGLRDAENEVVKGIQKHCVK